MWRETTIKEPNKRIFDEELDSFLPADIMDMHVHLWNEGVVPGDASFSCAGHPLRAYPIEELRRDLAAAFPGRRCGAMCFGLPEPAYDQIANDAYAVKACSGAGFVPLRLLDPVKDTADGLRCDLMEHGFAGIKPYPSYVRNPGPGGATILEMLPDWAMEVVNDLGKLVMLHIPRTARLADPLNQRQARDLCLRFPKARIVLAHIGRAYFLKCIAGHLDGLKDLPNLYYDTAMLNSQDVLEYAFTHLPEDKLLYGSDIPIALAPGKSVEINNQYTYVTPVPWELSISDDHGKLRFTSFLYEELRAIKTAAQRAGKGKAFVEAFFNGNAKRLLTECGHGGIFRSWET